MLHAKKTWGKKGKLHEKYGGRGKKKRKLLEGC